MWTVAAYVADMTNTTADGDDTMEWRHIRYDQPDPDIARIVLARPEKRNAQDARTLYELNAAFDRAAHDDEVKVIILAADGPHFSSGHDLMPDETITDVHAEYEVVGCWSGFGRDGAEGFMAMEQEMYLGFSWRWRNIPKPLIAEVQGKVIAGGLMLMWPCDLVVCSDDATFTDPVVALGVNGHEFHVHLWELGHHRRAKEMLFTGEAIDAREAHDIGMVNQVVSREDLPAATLDLARKVAKRSSFALMTAKQSVNQALEAQGMLTAIQAAYSLHILGHSHSMQKFGMPIDPAGPGILRAQARTDAERRTQAKTDANDRAHASGDGDSRAPGEAQSA